MSTTQQQRDAEWRAAERQATEIERDAVRLERDAEQLDSDVLRQQVARMNQVAQGIRETAEVRFAMPDVTEAVQGVIKDYTQGIEGRLQLATTLEETGETREWKAAQRARLVDEAKALRQDSTNRVIEAVQATVDLAHKTRYNPPRDAEKDRSQDLADAEILSRMRHPAEQLEAEARGYLAAGNPRGAMIRLDALALMGADTSKLRDLRKAIDAGLDETIPHRRQARLLEEAANAAVNEFAVAEATARARFEAALGHGPQAAEASIAVKMAAAVKGEGTRGAIAGAPVEPEPGPGATKPGRARPRG